jgi:1-acyl-sn-glycerol-3-phosphate acyltransferase
MASGTGAHGMAAGPVSRGTGWVEYGPMRSVLAWLSLPFLTLIFGGIALGAALLGVPNTGERSIYGFAFRNWSRGLLWMSGVKVVLHGTSHRHSDRRIFVANHLSRFDIMVLAAHLDQLRFVAKAELARIPFFGKAARAVGTIYVERGQTKQSVASLQEAAAQIDDGASVVMFPEGSRSPSYTLRPFKKGPFVLAISAGVPIVPTVIHGTLEVHPKGDWRVRRGEVNIHFLDPVSVEGLTYADRDALAAKVHSMMADFIRNSYGYDS